MACLGYNLLEFVSYSQLSSSSFGYGALQAKAINCTKMFKLVELFLIWRLGSYPFHGGFAAPPFCLAYF